MKYLDAAKWSTPRTKAWATRTRRCQIQVAPLVLMLIAGCGGALADGMQAAAGTGTTLHYAPNRNFDDSGAWRPGATGFNLADVSDPQQLRDLPAGVKGLIWVGLRAGVEEKFVATMAPYMQQRNVFGFYLMDDPDPRIGHLNVNRTRCARKQTGSMSTFLAP
jgi:hypothetical protein